jgi:hypothetical protein
MIIDVHTHIGPFAKHKGKSVKDIYSSMDNAGINISLVIANNFGHENKGYTTAQLINIVKKYPRLKVIGNIDYAKIGKNHIEDLKEFIKKKLIVGIKCYVGYENYYPISKKLHAFYKFCSDYNIPIIYHSGYILPESQGLLKYSHPLAIDKVATMFPDLKIVIAHIGNPWIVDCAAVVAKNKNVYVDFAGQFTEFHPISKEDRKGFVENVSIFKSLSGTCRCMFGTDWWYYSQREYLHAVKCLKLSKKEEDMVLWKNAKKVFNI